MNKHHDYRENSYVSPREGFATVVVTVAITVLAFVGIGVLLALG